MGNQKKNSLNRTVEILAFPPFAILPIIFLGMLMRGMDSIDTFPISLAATQLFIYAALSIASISWMKKGKYKIAIPASITANGLMIVFVAAELNTHAVFGWIGLLMLLIGVIMLIGQLSPVEPIFSKKSMNLIPQTMTKTELKKLLSAIHFPTALLRADENGKEIVVEANEPFSAVLRVPAATMIGETFSSLVPDYKNGTSFKYANAEWISHKSTIGNETLFMLSPAIKVKEQRPDELKSAAQEKSDIVDKDTGLYTWESMQYIARYAVQECRRYNSRLVVVFMKLVFDGKAVVIPSDDACRRAFCAFARALALFLRPCDSAYQTYDYGIIIFMPDSSQDKAKTLVEEMHDSIKKLATIECVELGLARLIDASASAVGEDAISVDQIVDDVHMEMDRKYKD
ncbi:MAG: hypothetical protein LBQ58_02290 [Synergistaceae bacterium]|jgi:GGDEF domain-containing protein|nr:hypothetical protein [Synergistaceae bacterium]